MFKSTTTNMNGGVTNAASFQTMGFSGVPDPTYAHVVEDDFDAYITSKWVLSGTGAVTPTVSSTTDGGAITLTTGAVAADSTVIQSAGGMILNPAGGKAAFFKVAASMASVGTTGFYAGWINEGAALSAPVSGIYFELAVGGANLLVQQAVGSTVTTLMTLPNPFTNNVMVELGLAVDSLGNLAAYVNPTTGKSGYARNAPSPLGVATGNPSLGYDALVAASKVTYPVGALSPTVGILTASAAAQTALVDFLVAVRER